MNRLLILSVVAATIISVGYASSIRVTRQVIPREFQNINIENYLKNERAVRFQLKCILDDGAPCDRIGKYLKVMIPDLLTTQCANCDDKQRDRARTLVTHIQQNFPEDWDKAVKKFMGDKLVSTEDAAKLKEVLGVELDPKFIEPATAEPVPEPEVAPVETPDQ